MASSSPISSSAETSFGDVTPTSPARVEEPLLRVRQRVALALDRLALVATAILMWRVFFAPNKTDFDVLAILVALTAIAAASASGQFRPLGNGLDLPILVYAGLSVLSAIWHRDGGSWMPVIHTAAIPIFLYGMASQLRSTLRLNLFLLVVIVAAGAIAVEVFGDRAVLGFDGRIYDFPSVPQWIGYAPLGLLFASVAAAAAAMFAATASRLPTCAAALVGLGFVVALVLVDSRSAYVAFAMTFMMLAAMEPWKLRTGRLAEAAGLATLSVVGLAATHRAMLTSVMNVVIARSHVEVWAAGERFVLWGMTLPLILAHPLIGVGEGHFHEALKAAWPASPLGGSGPLSELIHAHSLLVQIGAESGLPALFAFVLFWVRLLKAVVRTSERGSAGELSFVLFAMLLAFSLRATADAMVTGTDAAGRISFLVWGVVAAATAASALQVPVSRR